MKRPKFKLFSHFHKNFPFLVTSSWVQPTIYESVRDFNFTGNIISISGQDGDIKEIFQPMSESKIGYYSQTVATEYWLSKQNLQLDYVGVTGYRRYPLFMINRNVKPKEIYSFDTSPNSLELLLGDNNIPIITSILGTYDGIIPIRKWTPGGSVENQFLLNQNAEIWKLFLEAVFTLGASYSKYIDWFKIQNFCNYYGPMGLIPFTMFKDYQEQYMACVSYILKHSSNPFALLNHDESIHTIGNAVRTDRWIGYCAERFFPFFLFVNNVRTYETPVVLLEPQRARPVFGT